MTMRRSIIVLFLLGALCNASFAEIILTIDAPQDDLAARGWACGRPEVQSLHSAYTNLTQRRIWPLKFSAMPKIFGPKLETATNWWGSGTNGIGEGSGPTLARRPADLVLPIFAPAGGTNCGGSMMMVGGLHSTDPEKNKSHTDLYAIGDLCYVELYSQLDGETVQTAVIYFRSDGLFRPLKSPDDFSARLLWEKRKFDAVERWFDAHVVAVK